MNGQEAYIREVPAAQIIIGINRKKIIVRTGHDNI
jgi:hypothetical protein